MTAFLNLFHLRPFVPMALAFGCGILAASTIHSFVSVMFAVLAAVLFAAGRFTGSPSALHAALILGFAAAGSLRMVAFQDVSSDDVSRFAGGAMVSVRGTVASEPDFRERTVSLVVSAESVERYGGSIESCTGLAACTLVRGKDGVAPDFGDSITVRGTLEKPEPARNPGGFDSAGYLARRRIFSVLFARRAGAWSVVRRDDPVSPIRIAGRLRRSLPETAARYLPSAEAGLLCGIMIGSRSTLPRQIDDDFQLTGTAHVLATAGLHVGLVALLLHGILRAGGASRRMSAAVSIVLLLIYAVVAGGRPSVVRAVLVTDIWFLGILLQREPDAANSLAAAALALMAFRPGALFDAGFQLSFATVGSIILIRTAVTAAVPLISRWIGNTDGMAPRPIGQRIRGYLLNILLLTGAAQAGSAPLVAQYFNIFSPSGFLANLLIVPALIPVLGLGLILWGAAALGLPVVPDAAALLLHPLLSFIIGAARTCSELPLAAVTIPSPGWPAITAYYAGLAILAHRLRRRALKTVIVESIEPEPVELAR